jgi:hypothetical protein
MERIVADSTPGGTPSPSALIIEFGGLDPPVDRLAENAYCGAPLFAGFRRSWIAVTE